MISVINSLGFASALLVDIIIAARFGLSSVTDAIFIAFTLPQLIASILLVSFNVVLVPIFTKVLIESGKDGLDISGSNMVNLNIIGFTLLGIMGILASPVIISVLGAGLNSETKELAISLSRIMFLMVIPLGGIEVLKALLNTLREFAFPAASILILNLMTFIVLILSFSKWGVYSLAIGYVIGIWAVLFILSLVLILKGFKYQAVLSWRDPNFRIAINRIRYPLFGAILGQSNIIFERFLASFLPVGMVAALGYARRLLRAIDRIFISSISTVFLPRLSGQFIQNDTKEYKNSLTFAIKLAIFISFPIAVGIISLSVIIVNLLLGRGAFDINAISITAALLSIYILSIPAMALYQVMNTSFYAFGDTKTPFFNRITIFLINIIADIILFFVFGVLGIALGLTIARIFGIGIITRKLNQRLNFFDKDLVIYGIKIGLASIVMGVSVYILRTITMEISPDLFGSFFLSVLWIIFAVLLAAVVFILSILLLRVREVHQVANLVRIWGLSKQK
jgi:putative peptidoglycan lipid II flippase